MAGLLKKFFGSAQDRTLKRYRKIIDQVNDWEEQFQSLSDAALRQKTEEFKKRMREGALLEEILPEAYAVVKNTCRRLLGTQIHVSGYNKEWDMVPFDVQILDAIAIHN